MDPQATLYELLAAIESNDRHRVEDALAALHNWNASGGFLPTVTRPAHNDPARLVVYSKQPKPQPPQPCPTVKDGGGGMFYSL